MAATPLKPFQIRNLHDSPAKENLYDSSTESVLSHSPVEDAQTKPSSLIRLSAGEYDDIVRNNPDGSLTYIDEDDGDMITVGSSFELEQRLDEPTPYTAIPSPHQSEPVPVHLFDIRRRNSIIKLWKHIEQSSKLRWDLSLSEQETPELTNPSESAAAGALVQPRALSGRGSNDMRKKWLDACRPPQLHPQVSVEPLVSVPVSNNGESTSPSIMSLSAITEEGRRQAEEAGNRIRNFRNMPTSTISAVPDSLRNQQNPWAVTVEDDADSMKDAPILVSESSQAPKVQQSPDTENETKQSEQQQQSEPLLSLFEAEMAKIMESSQNSNNRTEDVPPQNTSEAHSRDSPEQTWPVTLVTEILHTVAGGMEKLGSELRANIPEVERHLSNAQRTIPEDVGRTMHSALSAVDAQINNLAQMIQRASVASGEAAERVRQADLSATEQVINGIGDVAHDLEGLGRTLFAAFEAEFGRPQHPQNEENITDRAAATTADDASAIHQQTEKEVLPVDVESPAPPSEEEVEQACRKAAAIAASRAQFLRRRTGIEQYEQMFGPLSELQKKNVEPLAPGMWSEALPEVRSIAQETNAKEQANTQVGQEKAESMLSTTRSDLLSEIRNRSKNTATEQAQTQVVQEKAETRSGLRRSELLSEIRSAARRTTAERQGPAQTETPLFSNWPNRPAMVVSPKPAIEESSVTQVSTVSALPQPPLPPKIANNKPHKPSQPKDFSTRTAAPSTDARSRKTLFMGNIGWSVTEKNLEDVFASELFLAKVHLPVDIHTGKHAGFGFAHFNSEIAAREALSVFQGKIIDGFSLNLEYWDGPFEGFQDQPTNDRSRTLNGEATSLSQEEPAYLQGQNQRRPPMDARDNLSSVFSGNARSVVPRASVSGLTHSRSLTRQDHPEETPEFAARYPSLLPTFAPDLDSSAAPARTRTLSPNSEMARFPPVSQIDAHRLASNQSRSREALATNDVGSTPRGKGLARRDTVFTTEGDRPMRELRRTASNVNRRSVNHSSIPTDRGHGLRRRATEAHSLRRHAHTHPFPTHRPLSLYDRAARPIPGSFPVDESPAPANNDNEMNTADREIQEAMRQSLIEQCVDQLLKLGYGSYVEGGRDRLRIVAEAANLQVSDAIDMIEEERKAYKRFT